MLRVCLKDEQYTLDRETPNQNMYRGSMHLNQTKKDGGGYVSYIVELDVPPAADMVNKNTLHIW